MTQLWCNGQWLDFTDFPAVPLDRGAILGLGLFETLLAVDGIPIFADRHLARLRKGCEKLRWDVAVLDFHEIARDLLVRNQLTRGRAKLRLAVTAGSGPTDDLAAGSDRLVWMVALLAGDIPDGLTADLSPWPRNERSPLVGLKCASYAENLIALDHARQQGFEETIFLNTAGHLCEAATANLFLVKNGTLQTPSLASGCLPGICREVVIELANRHQIPCEERVLAVGDLHAADEVFLTSATRGPVAVTRLGALNFPSGQLTGKLRKLWNEETQGPDF